MARLRFERHTLEYVMVIKADPICLLAGLVQFGGRIPDCI
jgi:hypothetical protein